MNILETEIDVWSLSELDLNETGLSIRSDYITMLWTRIECLDLFVLNLLAPRYHAFWDMGAFKAFNQGHHRVGSRLSERETVRSKIHELLRELGQRDNPLFVWGLLGGITRPFGDRFFSRGCPSAALRFASRIESFAVPPECREAVSQHFRRQEFCFRQRSLIAIPEDREFVVTAQSQGEASGWADLLALPVLDLSRQQRRAILSALEDVVSRLDTIQLDRDLDVSFGRPGNILIALPFVVREKPLLDEFLKIAALRLKIALKIGALPFLERLRDQLLTPGWEITQLADMRASGLERIGRRLLSFPDLIANPFQLVA